MKLSTQASRSSSKMLGLPTQSSRKCLTCGSAGRSVPADQRGGPGLLIVDMVPDLLDTIGLEPAHQPWILSSLHRGFTIVSFTRLSCANMDPQDLGIGRLFERIQDAVIVAVAETRSEEHTS